MRNLKKILALVLALVMSLSLMATAGASQFPDVDDSNPYAIAIDVLDELKVFQGFDDGTFKPTDTLNRAQAAVLVYRIATGDVENKYLDNYTFMQQSKFTDLDGYNWAKGYINYCQNAGIVVGTSSTTFDPGAKVTGYQLLVMLLRTLGYGKAGEFADPKGWELKTATIAESEGITKNVTAGDFGAPAPRQMVAEILFRGLLTETVEYSALVPGGYTKSGETLGMREFGLEKVSGVVMANEWANLEGSKVVAADTTVMKVDGKNITVTKGTELDAVGLTYNAYIANGEGSTKRALTLEAGDNNVAFNEGKGVNTGLKDESYKSIAKLAEEAGISDVNGAEYYLNYEENWSDNATSEWVIRYVISDRAIDEWYTDDVVSLSEKTEWVKYLEENADITDWESKDENGIVTDTWTEYTRTVRPGKEITATDLDIMEEIFANANRQKPNPDNQVSGFNYGEVYAGTSSLKDLSDEMPWVDFVADYLKMGQSEKYKFCENGNSLRVIDNNKDGKAEYVLKVAYTQDEVVGTHKDAALLNSLKVADYSGNNLYNPDEPAVGDVVNYTIIDGKLSMWTAEKVNGTISTKNFKDVTVTVTDGETYGQSGIVNATSMDEDIMQMADKTEYDMYLDEFGYIRTYELAQGSQYALLTEMYPTNGQNFNYVKDVNAIAEVTIGDADTTEYGVNGGVKNVFFNQSVWTRNELYYTTNNYLQPAMAHLGNPNRIVSNYFAGATTGAFPYTEWGRKIAAMQNVEGNAPVDGNYGVFDYGAVSFEDADGETGSNGSADHSFSLTNVAAYGLDGDVITLNSASRLAFDKNGNQLWRLGSGFGTDLAGHVDNEKNLKNWYCAVVDPTATAAQADAWFDAQTAKLDGTGIYPVYKIDYVKLAPEAVKANTRHYTIAGDYNEKFNTWSNSYVDATVDTEFYIVTGNSILYKLGYADLPSIDAAKVRASYAVAHNTASDKDGKDYWVADVIVIEVDGLEHSFDSISLMYYNPYETYSYVQNIDTLNNKWFTYQPESEDKAMIDVIPADVTGSGGWANWANHSWSDRDYGFYTLWSVEKDDNGDLAAGDVKMITKDFNDYGIYAGTVTRIQDLQKSQYMDVDTWNTGSGFSQLIQVRYSDEDVPFYSITEDRGIVTADELTISEVERYSDVKTGDQIIWAYDNNAKRLAFVVNLGDPSTADTREVLYDDTAAWLKTVWQNIIDDQNRDRRDALTLKLAMVNDNDLSITCNTAGVEFVPSVGFDDPTSADYHTGNFRYADGINTFTFTVNKAAAAVIAAVSIDGDWGVYGPIVPNPDGSVTITVVRVTNQAKSMVPAAGVSIVATWEYIKTNFVDKANDLITKLATATGDEKAEIEKELKTILTDLKAYKGAAIAKEDEMTVAITAVEVALGENPAVNAVEGIKDAWTAYNNAGSKDKAVTDALVDAIEAYKAAESAMTDEQKADAQSSLTAATNAIKALDNDFMTAYNAWKSEKNWAKVDAANTKATALKDYEIAAVEAVEPEAKLTEKVAEVKSAFAEAKPFKEAYDAVVEANAAQSTSGVNETTKSNLIKAWKAAVALGMNQKTTAGNQPVDLMTTSDVNWDSYLAGMTWGERYDAENQEVLPELTSITMDPYKAAFYGMEVGEPSEAVDGVVTVKISMPAGMDPVEIANEGDFGEWFGATGLQYVGASWSVENTNEITITGKNTDETLTVKLDWVDSGVAKYRAMMWGNTSICLALYNIGTGSWMSQSDIRSLGVDNGTSFGFSMNGRVKEFAYDSFGEQTTAGLWGDSDSATYGFVKYVPDSLGNNADLFTGDNAPKISADSMNKKLAGATVSFELVNNTDVDITFWSATVHMGS